ncbi:hypothetical protein N7476_004745 [Penicillium atrosanguineum]|uniref:Thioester reductase (TE) domain-containing protein n=1 Tax=Penicillium atrosanguineum TaxID=1132637 RepID=A0A9W9U5G8_9EURO|nr:hypothetical protein N7476_004745 [Penicillium atrosanguineum]
MPGRRELTVSLLSGSTIVVVPSQIAIDPLTFRDFIGERQLSVIFLTTSLFNATAVTCPTAFQGVREVLTTGEVASPLAIRTVLESGGRPERLWNTYGPTETTTFSTIQLVTLEEAQREKIGIGQPSVIFHLGAKVNFCDPYEAHFDANILGMKNVLQIATSGRLKSFHVTSSIDAWGPNGLILGTRKCLEDDTLEPNSKGLPYDIGYAASKWTSEQMVRRARDRGLPTAIYRPVFITGDSNTGAGNPDDFFALLMVGSIQIRAFPCLHKQRMEYVTVDYVCNAMRHIASDNANLGQSYSLVAPDPADSINLEDTVDVINGAGYPVEKIPYWDWVKRLQEPKYQDNPLMPLMPLLQEKVWGDLTRFETSRDTPHYDSGNAVASLANSPEIGYSPFSPDQLNRFLVFWRTKGLHSV